MTEQEIFAYLKGKGFNDYAVAGIMGNLQDESGFHSDIIQGDIPYSSKSKEYTAKVDSGVISENDFVYNGPGGGGYGYAQWTYQPRKRNLYRFAKQRGASIGDPQMQLDFLCLEIETEYPSVYNVLKNTSSYIQASDVVLLQYENPANAVSKKSYRSGLARDIYNKYTGTSPTYIYTPPVTAPVTLADYANTQKTNMPVLSKGSKGIAVGMAQFALQKKNYLNNASIDCDYGPLTVMAVNAFKADKNIPNTGSDYGVINAVVWEKLYE